MFEIINLILLIILFISAGLLIKNKYFKLVILSMGSIFILLQVVSLLTIGEFFNYQVYINMKSDVILAHISQFYIYACFLIILCFLLPYVLFHCVSMIRKYITSVRIISSSLVICIALLCYPSFVLGNLYGLYQDLNVNVEGENFSSSLSNIGINPKEYTYYEDVVASGGKNIIVISLESVEQSFLKGEFSHLTPNLKKLSDELTFYDNFKQSLGGSWTSGSLYSYLVGVPALFKHAGNEIFQQSRSSQLTGLGNVLKEANYNTKYILSKSKVSGMNDLLKTYNINPIDENSSIGSYKKHRMGLDMHDYDVFEEAKLQLNEFQKSDKKFALFLSTLDTHFPNGIVDKRMEKYLERKNYNSDLEFTIASVDYLIGDFFNYLRKERLLENTAVFIFPDHRMMGKTGKMYNRLKKYDRKLYLLTNVEDDTLKIKTSDRIYQIDLPRMIIEGSFIKTNARFLVDFLKNRDIETFLNENKSDLIKLNMTALNNQKYLDDIKVELDENKLKISSKDNYKIIDFKKENKKSFVVDVVFDRTMKIKGINRLSRGKAFILSKNDRKFNVLHLLITINNNQIKKIYFGDKQSNYVKKYFPDSKISSTDIKRVLKINDTNFLKINITSKMKKANKSTKDSKRFIAHGGGVVDGYVYTNSLEALNENYKKGFKLFELDIIKTSDNHFVAAHDWKLWKKMTNYKGTLPPSKKVFLEHKIYDRYTPMDMEAINNWFKVHKDAKLVTDKIKKLKDVKGFIGQFIDKDRLMMELFAWGHVKKAIELGINSAMPTGGLLKPNKTAHLKEGLIEYLHKLGVKDIASSTRMLDYKDLLKDITHSGINVYAFQINRLRDRKLVREKKLTKEEYVICKLQNHFYGVYANKWDFDKKTPCSLKD